MSIMFKLANNFIQGAHGFNSIVVSFVMTVFVFYAMSPFYSTKESSIHKFR